MKLRDLLEQLQGVDLDAKVYIGGISGVGDEPPIDHVATRGFGCNAEVMLFTEGVRNIEDTQAFKRAVKSFRDDADALEHEVESLERQVERLQAEIVKLRKPTP